MPIVANVLVGFIALQHAGFLVIEMFLWQRPIILKAFRMTPEKAAASAVVAKNQGLYNGFLAAGLLWGLLTADSTSAFSIKTFFLTCIAIAGIYGSLTASRSILWIQAAPAMTGLLLLLMR